MKKPKKVLLLGSGPIVIGQASEFDYSGVQALKALKEEGIETVVVNSNLATIMTDPALADATYLEPLRLDYLVKIIEKERPDAIVNTLGGQVALNLSVQLEEEGILSRFGIELLGASAETVRRAEDRELFKRAALKVGLRVPPSKTVSSVEEGLGAIDEFGLPAVIRPFFTLGGSGGSVVKTREEAETLIRRALDVSPVGKCLIEKSVLGWREFELEVVVDGAGNSMVVCSIENVDPMGVHTGDSITVAPALTLDDRSYQALRDGALALVRELGVRTGGSNVQFAVNPSDPSDFYVIEVNPRVSRSSALASKATGFPIAWVATKLALGYTLPEIRARGLDIPASFEPALDYVAVKVPRFDLEKFPGASWELGVQMKSVGEAMGLGRSFPEALQKAIRSLEQGWNGLNSLAEEWLRRGEASPEEVPAKIRELLLHPNPRRVFAVADGLRWGFSVEEIADLTGIHPFFIGEIKRVIEVEDELLARGVGRITPELLLKAKRLGFSDSRLAELLTVSEDAVRRLRARWNVSPAFYTVDTCAAEHPSRSSYHYSTYWGKEREPKPLGSSIVILGAGPARIGQSLEFDYSSVQAIKAVQEEGLAAIIVNSNPETVSTDYDISDRLYFEPVEPEAVLEVLRHERPQGLMLQFGGQTPLNMAKLLASEGFRVLGTQPEDIERAEDRRLFWELLDKLGVPRPPAETALTPAEALGAAERLGYPVLLRPSFVLGGRRMHIVWGRAQAERVLAEIFSGNPGHVSVDKFLLGAREYDVEVLSDGEEVFVAGVIEHIQEAGVHSGDSSALWPPVFTPKGVVKRIEEICRVLVKEAGVVGIANVQVAWFGEEVYVLELNPRASRTVPYLSKAAGLPLAKMAAKILLGRKLRELVPKNLRRPKVYFVKEPVFSFTKLPGAQVLVGPEMRSTGEAAGVSPSPYEAVLKGLWAAGWRMPEAKLVYLAARDSAKPELLEIARIVKRLGYGVLASPESAEYLREHGFEAKPVGWEELAELIATRQVACVVDVPEPEGVPRARRALWNAFLYGVPCFLTPTHAKAFWVSLEEAAGASPLSLQEVHGVPRA